MHGLLAEMSIGRGAEGQGEVREVHPIATEHANGDRRRIAKRRRDAIGRPYALPGIMLTRGAHAAFLDDSGALLVACGSLGHTNIWRLDLHAVTESLLVELPPDFVVGDFTVEEDDSALIVERVEDSTYLTLIERPDPAAR